LDPIKTKRPQGSPTSATETRSCLPADCSPQPAWKSPSKSPLSSGPQASCLEHFQVDCDSHLKGIFAARRKSGFLGTESSSARSYQTCTIRCSGRLSLRGRTRTWGRTFALPYADSVGRHEYERGTILALDQRMEDSASDINVSKSSLES